MVVDEKNIISHQINLLEFHQQAISIFINETINDGLENVTEANNEMFSIQEAINNTKESSTEAFNFDAKKTLHL